MIPFYNDLKIRKTDECKNIFQIEKLFTISKRLSKAYFFSENIYKKKPDHPTQVLGWKKYPHQTENDAITILVQKSIETI